MSFLHINGIDLYYEITGDGPPLALIHGLGAGTRSWNSQLSHFAANYRVMRFDLRGHGQSAHPPGPYSIALLADDTAKLLNALGIAPAHIVGLSLGGMVALQLALDAPDLVRSLVVVNSVPKPLVGNLLDRARIVVNYLRRVAILRWRSLHAMGEYLGTHLLPGPEYAAARQAFMVQWAMNDDQAYRAALSAIRGWDVSRRVNDIRCPTLFVTGDQDYTPIAAKAEVVAHMPRAELAVISNSRHLTPIDQPDQFNKTVLAFLARQSYDGHC